MFQYRSCYNISESPVVVYWNKKKCHYITAEYTNRRNGKVECIDCYLFCTGVSVGKQDIVSMKYKGNHIMVISSNITFQAIEFIKSLGVYWEYLGLGEVAFDKMAHSLVPVYRILTIKEESEIKNKYQDICKFPKMIYKADPIARFMDFRPGDVLEIKRKYSEQLSYRVVIHVDDLV